jgi:hypothetical protein
MEDIFRDHDRRSAAFHTITSLQSLVFQQDIIPASLL